MSTKLCTMRSSSDDARVEVRELVDRLDHGAGDERQVGEPEALGCLPLLLHRVAGDVDVGEIDLDDAEGVRADAFAHHHVAAGELADLRQPHGRVALARRERRRCGGCWRDWLRRCRGCCRGRRRGSRGGRRCRDAAGGCGAGAAAAPCDAVRSMKSRTSSRVIRPPGPLPEI